MEDFLFPSWFLPVVRLGAMVYLGLWLVRGTTALWRTSQAWLAGRSVAGRLTRMATSAQSEDEAWLGLAGVVLGTTLVFSVGNFIPGDRLLLVLLALGLILEGLRPPRGLSALPSVLALLHACRAQPGGDVLTACEGIQDQLPLGVVREALAKALRKRQQGLATEMCLRTLTGISPFLDEFIAECKYAGWQAGPALNVVLQPLIGKATAEWNRTIKVRRFFEQAEMALSLARYAAVGGLLAAFLWTLPNPVPAQALEPSPTSTRQVTRSPRALPTLATATLPIATPSLSAPVLSTSTTPRHPPQTSPAPKQGSVPTTATPPPLPTATSPMITRMLTATPPAIQSLSTATAPVLEPEPPQPTAPVLPNPNPTPPAMPGG